MPASSWAPRHRTEPRSHPPQIPRPIPTSHHFGLLRTPSTWCAVASAGAKWMRALFVLTDPDGVLIGANSREGAAPALVAPRRENVPRARPAAECSWPADASRTPGTPTLRQSSVARRREPYAAHAQPTIVRGPSAPDVRHARPPPAIVRGPAAQDLRGARSIRRPDRLRTHLVDCAPRLLGAESQQLVRSRSWGRRTRVTRASRTFRHPAAPWRHEPVAPSDTRNQ